jgi:histidinol-phosphate/aromatic aminotransferase/cobyric acid decarboxylase-like protein
VDPPADLEAFIASVPRNVLVVLDEAYNEYLEPADRADSVAWIAKFPHLAVSRSFSKAYGLAALRIGYGVMAAQWRTCSIACGNRSTSMRSHRPPPVAALEDVRMSTKAAR